MDPDKYLIGIIAFLVIIIGGVMLIGDYNTNYEYSNNTMSDDDFAYINNATEQFYSDTQDIKDGVIGSEVDQENSLDSMLIGAYQSMRLVFNSFSIVSKVINSIAIKIGIPDPFVALAIVAILIIIVFGIIYILFRR